MSNEIDGVSAGNLPKIADVSGNRRVDSEKPADSGSAATRQSPDDTVALTANAKLLERVEASLETASDVDVQRVEALKSAIADGSYQIDDRQIADKILRSDVERG